MQTAGPLDAEILAALQSACFPEEPWDAGSIASLCAPPEGFALLALRGDEPVGFVLARAAAGEGEILVIGVLPAERRSGVGRRLVEATLAHARQLDAEALFLEVAEDNGAARTLYMANDFFSVGRRPGYYKRPSGPVAALVLRHTIRKV
ncbi:GNAT family N-acetyltransferase [Azospirillum cavernae]|uniref:GNAT family N-acetyltransferase n=1 Tax=Azospirillum cavernae TaxID=2320860 RepID=A0A418VZ09_9PROT|nr:GNAT family N-acetyltransferase [Azospirillum cavernae]